MTGHSIPIPLVRPGIIAALAEPVFALGAPTRGSDQSLAHLYRQRLDFLLGPFGLCRWVPVEFVG